MPDGTTGIDTNKPFDVKYTMTLNTAGDALKDYQVEWIQGEQSSGISGVSSKDFSFPADGWAIGFSSQGTQ